MTQRPIAPKRGSLRFINYIPIGNRILWIYANDIHPEDITMTAYYDEENNPVQHKMSWWEVVEIIKQELLKERGEWR